MSIKLKILKFCEEKELKISSVAKKIDVSSTNFIGRNLESSIGSDALVKFLKHYPEVSAEWLMRDEGPMLRTEIAIGEQNINNGVNNGHIGSEHMLDSLTESLSKPQTPVDVSIPVSCDWKGCLILQMKQEVIDAMRITIKTLQENPEK